MKTPILLLFLSIFLATFAQKHTDIKEYGFRGKAKKIITYTFDSTRYDSASKTIADTGLWINRKVFVFNRKGNLESETVEAKYPNHDTVFWNKKEYVYKKKERYALNLNAINSVMDTINYKWLNDTAYSTTEINERGGFKLLSNLYLQSNYRDKSGKYVSFNDKNEIDFCMLYENTIDENNLLESSLKTNVMTGEITITEYKYFDLDKQKNPTKIIVRDKSKNRLDKIIFRLFEYY